MGNIRFRWRCWRCGQVGETMSNQNYGGIRAPTGWLLVQWTGPKGTYVKGMCKSCLKEHPMTPNELMKQVTLREGA